MPAPWSQQNGPNSTESKRKLLWEEGDKGIREESQQRGEKVIIIRCCYKITGSLLCILLSSRLQLCSSPASFPSNLTSHFRGWSDVSALNISEHEYSPASCGLNEQPDLRLQVGQPSQAAVGPFQSLLLSMDDCSKDNQFYWVRVRKERKAEPAFVTCYELGSSGSDGNPGFQS